MMNEPKKNTLKQQYAKAQGQEIAPDYFLYTAKEEEDTILGTKFAFVKGKSYSESSQEVGDTSLADSVAKICGWYKNHYPQLASDKTLDYQTHGAMIQGFVLLKLDLDKLLKKEFTRIPFRTLEEQNKKTWDTIDQNLNECFPSYSKFMIKYLEWHYQETKRKAYDLKSIPPTGRFIGILKRNFGHQAFYSSRDRDHDKSYRGARPQSGGRSYHKSDRRPQRNTDDGSTKREDEKKALQEVQEALKKFEKNPSLKVITLKPQNSFIRRVQHKKVAENGFVSNSVGEDSKRSIQIKRV